MAKKQYFLIVDSETTKDDTVADFGAVICDRKGVIAARCGVLVKDHFGSKELFYDPTTNGFWGKVAAQHRQTMYEGMLNDGRRTLASVAAINRWLSTAIGRFNPSLTAYNLAFDADKCGKTGIDLTGFKDKFCLWQAAVGNICKQKAFKQFALENHAFNNRTDSGNLTFQTNAEIVAGFVAGSFTAEPHTALEDAEMFELPILKHILTKRDWREKITPYNWRAFQMKDHFQPR